MGSSTLCHVFNLAINISAWHPVKPSALLKFSTSFVGLANYQFRTFLSDHRRRPGASYFCKGKPIGFQGKGKRRLESDPPKQTAGSLHAKWASRTWHNPLVIYGNPTVPRFLLPFYGESAFFFCVFQ